MVLALTGLGCQNGAVATIDTPPLPTFQLGTGAATIQQPTQGLAIPNAVGYAPTPYPEIGAHVYDRNPPSEPVDWHTALRYTLYSFVWGRDPNVSTAQEIEASVYGYSTAH
jgi:hypothetical protein